MIAYRSSSLVELSLELKVGAIYKQFIMIVVHALKWL